jgi:branched-subunit amino acid ABC-type transport system permease component
VTSYLPFLVTGVTAGSLYGLAGVGLVLTYKTSGVFNFSHGAVAATAAFIFFELHNQSHVPWLLALLIAVAGVGVFGGFVIERLARRLADVRPVLAIASTIGLLLLIQGLLNWRFGFTTRQFPNFVADGGFKLSGVLVEWQQLLSVVVAAAATIGLYLFFRLTTLGSTMRAVVDDADLLDLAGRDPVRVRLLSWVIGCSFAALTGVLIAPSLGLDAALLTLLVVQAFGAAAVGRFASLPLTYAGGLIIGVAASVLTKFVATHTALSGLPSSVPFLVLFAVLVLFPPERAPTATIRRRRPPVGRRLSPSRRSGLAVVVAAVIALAPVYGGAKLPVYTNAVVLIPVFLALSLLVWLSGQVSLCHAAFVAIGAAIMGHLAGGAGVPWFLAVLLAGLAVVPVGAVVAIPAIRLEGLYLALATFGFGILVERVLFGQDILFGAVGLRQAPRPAFAHSDAGYHVLVTAIAIGACLLVLVLTRSRLGRLLRALGDAPVALSTSGVGVSTTRLLAFCISAFLAGVSGALSIAATGSASGRSFGFENSLLWLTVLVICGSNVLRSAVLGALVLAVAPAYAPEAIAPHLPLIFGAVAVVATLLYDGFRVGQGTLPASDRARRSPARARTQGAPLPMVPSAT